VTDTRPSQRHDHIVAFGVVTYAAHQLDTPSRAGRGECDLSRESVQLAVRAETRPAHDNDHREPIGAAP
jgi:hypothetical protein